MARCLFAPGNAEFSNRHCSTTDRLRTIVDMPPAPARRLPSCRSDSVLEDAIYWLAAAPVLAYLGFLVLSL
jgi:hypothetical protein